MRGLRSQHGAYEALYDIMGLTVEELFELILRQPLPATQGQNIHVHEQQVQDLVESQGLHTAIRYVLGDSGSALDQNRRSFLLPAYLGSTVITMSALDENQLQMTETKPVAPQTKVPREIGVHLIRDIDTFVDDIKRINRTIISTEVTVPTPLIHFSTPYPLPPEYPYTQAKYRATHVLRYRSYAASPASEATKQAFRPYQTDVREKPHRHPLYG